VSTAMKVGDLARRTGLTIRALHHYDEIGLLSPATRTASGHRLYGRAEVERLQQIASLRHLGLSLDEIQACLSRPEYSLDRTLELQIERIEELIGRQKRLRDLIMLLRDRLRADGASVEELARTIEVTLSYEKYYSPEQLEQLSERKEEVGEERILEVQREWESLFAAYTRAMEQGLDPAGEDVKALARRSAALIRQFTGGNAGIAASLGAMYRAEGGPSVMASQGMQMAPGLWEYMQEAAAAL
jgi:DNA-binding transcriptional MerR regulator